MLFAAGKQDKILIVVKIDRLKVEKGKNSVAFCSDSEEPRPKPIDFSCSVDCVIIDIPLPNLVFIRLIEVGTL